MTRLTPRPTREGRIPVEASLSKIYMNEFLVVFMEPDSSAVTVGKRKRELDEDLEALASAAERTGSLLDVSVRAGAANRKR